MMQSIVNNAVMKGFAWVTMESDPVTLHAGPGQHALHLPAAQAAVAALQHACCPSWKALSSQHVLCSGSLVSHKEEASRPAL